MRHFRVGNTGTLNSVCVIIVDEISIWFVGRDLSLFVNLELELAFTDG